MPFCLILYDILESFLYNPQPDYEFGCISVKIIKVLETIFNMLFEAFSLFLTETQSTQEKESKTSS